MPHWPIPHVKHNIMLGLERVEKLLKNLGNPHHKLPYVIHISGTNGKGSTAAYLKAICEDAGLKVHRYISPHLVRFNERITLAGEEISDAYLYEIMEETRLANIGIHTTFFEATTAAAFLAFSRTPADVLLLEVGMGGRMDATNVITDPLLSMITPVSFDHVEFLGDTIAKIAYEKAGIIKAKHPVVVSWQMEEAMEVFAARCSEIGAELYAWGRHWNFEVNDEGFLFRNADSEAIQMPQPALMGLHQIVNASAVVAACQQYLGQTLGITMDNVRRGLENTVWQARMQHVRSGVLVDMLPEGFELWLDGAHNTGGAQMISATVASLWKDKPTYLINGRTGERDIKGFLSYFNGLAEAVYGIKVLSEPKGEKAENIANAALEMGFKAYACRDIKDAVERIIRDAPGPARILVTGSLYLAGDILLANEG